MAAGWVAPWSGVVMRGFLIFLFGAILGTAFGVAVGFFAFPYVFPPPEAKEVLSAEDKASGIVARGVFIHANPSDPVHYGKGKVAVFGKLVHLEADFEVGPGPAFHVYLSPKAKIRSSGDFPLEASLDLGKLRSFKGSQRYQVPAGTDLGKYNSVVIWCRQFGVLVSPADLKSAK
jgi:hypothetical protein